MACRNSAASSSARAARARPQDTHCRGCQPGQVCRAGRALSRTRSRPDTSVRAQARSRRCLEVLRRAPRRGPALNSRGRHIMRAEHTPTLRPPSDERLRGPARPVRGRPRQRAPDARARTQVLAQRLQRVAGLLLHGRVGVSHKRDHRRQRLARRATGLRLAVHEQLRQRERGLPAHARLAVAQARAHHLPRAQAGCRSAGGARRRRRSRQGGPSWARNRGPMEQGGEGVRWRPCKPGAHEHGRGGQRCCERACALRALRLLRRGGAAGGARSASPRAHLQRVRHVPPQPFGAALRHGNDDSAGGQARVRLRRGRGARGKVERARQHVLGRQRARQLIQRLRTHNGSAEVGLR